MQNENEREVIVIGASAGGVGALKRLLGGLPAGLQAVVLVVVHTGGQPSILPQILAQHSALPVRHAQDREALEPGVVLVAPPDYHLLVAPGEIRLTHGPKENFARPAIDPLFRSAALHYREKTIGVLLTGNLDDGTVGLQAVKTYGGVTIVQDPTDAEAPDMPRSALDNAEPDHCLPLDRIADMLVSLIKEPLPMRRDPHGAPGGAFPVENRLASMEENGMEALQKIGTLAPLTCPECHGTLWEIGGSDPPRFRCHTGHAFTARTLASAQDRLAEEAVWGAVRALHEKEALLRRFADAAIQNRRLEAAAEHMASADLASRQAQILRTLVSDD